MNAAEIKIDLFRKLDALKGSRLEEAYGVLLNFFNSKNDIDEWQDLTKEQQDAIKLGLAQLERGEGRNHREVMGDMRSQYANGQENNMVT